MGELSIAEVVVYLKPLCDSFMQEPSVVKAIEIDKLVARTSSTILQRIHDNILFPITHHVKNNTFTKDENLKLIGTVREVILRVRIESLKLFYEVYHCLRTQICQKDKSMELIESHEELKEIVVLCLRDLVKNSSISIIEEFYTRQRAPLISHGIYLCVKIARLEKSTTLRVAAIEAVMVMLQLHDESDSQDIVLRSQIADVVMLFLPGVVSGLFEVSTGTDIQNHKVTTIAIRAWSRAMALVMQDMPQEETTAAPSLEIVRITKMKDTKTHENMNEVLENAKRTPEWYSAVSEKFKIIFIDLDIITKHSHFKVRKELSIGVSLLLLNCSRNMKPCFQLLIEILITLSEDENSQVAEGAHKNLRKIQEKCLQDPTMKSAVENLEENLYDLLTKMPRIIRTAGESVQLVWLNRLAGYLKVLGKQRLARILLSTAHLKKLLITLIYISELDCNNISILEDITNTNFEEFTCYGNSQTWKQFKFLFNSISVEKLMNIFRILGELEDRKTLIDSILKMSSEIPKFKKELTLMLNTILEVPTDPEVQKLICKDVVEHYIDSDFWDLPLKTSDEVNLQKVQSNIVQICLLLEGLGIIANVLREDYQDLLLKTLYLIIEKAGSEHSLVRFLGLSTLEIIAKSQKLNTIGDLLRVNVDYVSYHVTVKLRRVERNPGVLDVVEVVTKYSTMDFLPHLKDIVDDLLLQSSFHIQKRNTQSFLKVFHAFVICVGRLKFDNNLKVEKENLEDSNTLRPSEIIINNILEYQKAEEDSRIFEKNDEMNSSDDDLLNSFEKETEEREPQELIEDKDEVPYFVEMTKNIMKRCLHFLPSTNFTELCLSMIILKEGLFILKEWENELLPIVHELWHPLVHRFQSPNPLIINHAWQLLCGLAQVSQDFIRSRFLKEVLPPLSNFLRKSSKESLKKDSGSTYRFTHIFKLQKQILSYLGSVVINLKLREKETWNILEIAELYLDCFQNPQLQENCVSMYKEISKNYADVVWIKCVDTWNRQVETVVPENNLTSWYLKLDDGSPESNYKNNLKEILTFLYCNSRIL